MADFLIEFEVGGKRHRLKPPADPRQARALASWLDRERSFRESGAPIPQPLIDEAGRFPRRVRNRLRDWGLLGDDARTGNIRALVVRYVATLRAGGRSTDYLALTETRLLAAIDGVPIPTLARLRHEPLIAWLAELRTQDGKLRAQAPGASRKSAHIRFGVRTSNGYLSAMKSFSKWLTVEGHLERDPLIRAKALEGAKMG